MLSISEFIKSDNGKCLLLGIGCLIVAVVLIFFFFKGKQEKGDHEKLNLKKEAKEEKVEEVEEIEEETEETKEINKSNTDYHISKHPDGGWQVKREKGKKALKIFSTQQEAIDFAKEKAENQENHIVIHKKTGKIRKQNYNKKD